MAILEFLGRIDDQVKLRGFRIELGEIEAVLNQHSAVEQAWIPSKNEQRVINNWWPISTNAPKR